VTGHFTKSRSRSQHETNFISAVKLMINIKSPIDLSGVVLGHGYQWHKIACLFSGLFEDTVSTA